MRTKWLPITLKPGKSGILNRIKTAMSEFTEEDICQATSNLVGWGNTVKFLHRNEPCLARRKHSDENIA